MNTCHYCKEVIDIDVEELLTKDHVYPKSKIKKDVEKEFPIEYDLHNNKVIACKPCNLNKGSIDYKTFIALGLIQIKHLKRMTLNKMMKPKKKRTLRRYR